MKITSFTSVVLAICLVTVTAPKKVEAQQPETDRFQITLSQAVTVGDKILQPGDYSVAPLNVAGGDAPVLLISGENGMRLQTSAMTAPALENRIQSETRVTLRHVGHRYYFDIIWVKGQAYGYRFPLPKGVKRSGGQ